MAERRTHPNGGVYERGPDGQWHLVSSQSPAMGPAIGNDPRIPLSVQGQATANQNAGVNLRVDQATAPAQIRKTNAEADNAADEIRQRRQKEESDLRTQFDGLAEVKDYKNAAGALSGMLRAPDNGQGDTQIIYAFIRSQGPGPVAEGELQLAQSAASLQQRLEAQYGKATAGRLLHPAARQGLIETARQGLAGKKSIYDQTYLQYRDLAGQRGFKPENITGPHVGDAIRPLEEKYIRQHGQTPHSAITGQPIAADPAAKFVTQNNPERSAFIDAMVRNNVPFERAQEAYRQQFPGAPVFESRAKWNEALSFARSHPNAAGSFGQSLDTLPLNQTEQDRNALGQTTAGQAATLYFNAAAGGIPSALAGQEGQQTVQGARDGLGGASLIPEGLGAITGTLGATKALGGASNFLKEAPLIGGPFNFLANNPTARMLGADLGYGGLYGATQNPDNPLAGAALGAGAGLAGNVIGSKVIAPGVRAGANALGFNPAPALGRGENLLAGQALKANPEDVMGRLQEASDLKMPFTLADADPRLRSIGGSVVRKSPDAFALAQGNLGSRGLGQADRAIDLIDNNLAPSVDVPTFKANAKTSAQTASRDLYKKAEANPLPDDAELNEMLRTPAGEKAVRAGYTRAANNGEDAGNLRFEADSISGETRYVGQPSWRVLQYAKQALDEMPEAEGLRRRFTARLGDLNPDFKAANAAYAKEIGKGDIVQSGYDAFNSRVSPEQLSANIAANQKNLPLFQQGFTSAMTDVADKARLSADPYNLVYGSPRQQTKLGQLFPEGSQRFATARGLEGDMSATNRELFGGSPTQPRAEADKLFEGGAMDSVFDAGLELAAGTPPISAFRSKLFGARGAFGAAQDALRLGVGQRAKGRADELAPLLFNPNAEETLAQLGDLIAAKRARDEYVRKTGMFGAGIGSPLAISYAANR